MEILRVAKAVAAGFQTADRLLEGLLVGLTNAHDLAHGAHLRAKTVLSPFKLFKCPAGKLDDNIITARYVLVQRSVLAAGDFIQRQAARQHSGHQGDRETGCLGGQRGGTGGTRVDLNDDHAVRDRIMRELYVGTADDADAFDDAVRVLLQTLLQFLGNRQHGSRAEGVARMHAHGVDVFDEADRDHLVLRVANHFQLQLFPAADGFLYQNLAHHAGLQAAGADHLQLFGGLHKAAARTAHRIGGAQNNGITQFIRNFQCLFHRVGDLAAGHLDVQGIHGILKFYAVLTTLDGIYLDTDNLDVILIQHACLRKLRAEV